ncbi:MAG: ribonuclease J [Bauldia sp.]
MASRPDLVFLPLGGVGEIGMNLSLYGFGRPQSRKWLAVDFGLAFPGPDLPGVDAILPDIAFLESERSNLLAIVITHVHEDHFGALLDLWPRLKIPVYATPFAAALIEAKCREEPRAPKIPVTVVQVGSTFAVGPFSVEMIAVAHSIPEPTALAIRTELGLVVHSGDWRIDFHPTLGPPTDVRRMQQLGAEGVLALICDSTNAMREGRSPGEAEVAEELALIIREAPERVIFTTFASNVARLRAIAEAAAAADREVVIVGRSLRRVIDVAGEIGLLKGLRPFYEAEAFGHLPRNKVVAIVTGSQGEPRAVLSRVAEGDHSDLALSSGDTVVFSSRTIPGNEKAVNQIINSLVRDGIRVVTDRDRLVHASGHPRRAELADLYSWLKPQMLLPVHGEPMHLASHAVFARSVGIGKIIVTENGRMVRLAPNAAGDVDQVASGRVYRDGRTVGSFDDLRLAERRRLAFAGHISIAVVLDDRGEILGDVAVDTAGLPAEGAIGLDLEEAIHDAVSGALRSIPRARRRDPDLVRDALRRAARAAVEEHWGKKPVCSVLVQTA